MKQDAVLPSPADKEHLKEVVLEYLTHPEYTETEDAKALPELAAAVCAVCGRFDLSVVLEHVSGIMEAGEFLEGERKGFSLQTLAVNCALYWFLDRALPSGPKDPDFKKMRWLLFDSCHCRYANDSLELPESKVYLPRTRFTEPIQSVICQERVTEFFILADMDPEPKSLIRNAAYTALLDEKWTFFAGLCSRYDLKKFMNMEKVFNFWSDYLLVMFNDRHRISSPAEPEFIRQWKDPEHYPLHRMMTDYGRDLCIPLLFQRGFLYPEVILELWDAGVSFDRPLTRFYQWETLTFPVFASRFSGLSASFAPVWKRKCIRLEDWKFQKTLESAEIFREYAAAHPRKGPVKSSGTVRKKRGVLTEEQLIRLANDEARGIEFSFNHRKLMKYRDVKSVTEYAVPDFVTSIGEHAFGGGCYLKTVILPGTVSGIGKWAFSQSSAENVRFSAGLLTIAEGAFSSSHIREVRLPEGVTGIGYNAFRFCDRLESVFLPDTLTNLESFAFFDCRNLAEIHLSAGLASIPGHAFGNCPKLESIVIPDGVQSIGLFAFDGCSNLRSAEVPMGIQIHKTAFNGCPPDLKITFRDPPPEN